MIGCVRNRFTKQTVFIIYEYVTTMRHTNYQLTVGVIVQLVKHCSDIVALMGSNLVQACGCVWFLCVFLSGFNLC